MSHRANNFRLFVAAAIAVLLHLLVIPSIAQTLLRAVPEPVGWPSVSSDLPLEPDRPVDENAPPDEPDQPTDEVVLGQDDAPETFSIAWIAWDDYQDMVGRQSRTHQPALQSQVDPTPDAPVNVDATEPAPIAPTAEQAAMPTPPVTVIEPQVTLETPAPPPPFAPPAPEQVEAESPAELDQPAQQEVALLPDVLLPRLDEQAPLTDDQMVELPLETQPPAASPQPQEDAEPADQQASESPQVTDDAEPAAVASAVDQTPQQPTEQTDASDAPMPPDAASDPQPPADRPDPPQQAASPSDATPTSAPRDQSESDPAEPDPQSQQVRPGRVLTTRGIQIITARPQFSVVARTTALPNNPLARLHFDQSGTVVRAELLQRTGYGDIDGAVLASLYRWRAVGEELEKREQGFSLEIRIILMD